MDAGLLPVFDGPALIETPVMTTSPPAFVAMVGFFVVTRESPTVPVGLAVGPGSVLEN